MDFSKHEAAQPIFEHDGVEIHQQSRHEAAQAEIGQDLGLVDRQEPFERSDLDEELALGDDVAAIQPHGLGDNGERDLP